MRNEEIDRHASFYLCSLKVVGEDDVDDSAGSSAGKVRHTAPRGNYKMVLIVRNDLKMGKGKVKLQNLSKLPERGL